jgi:hypothetical protein
MQQGGTQPLMKQLRETFHNGTAIVCAAPKDKMALAKRERAVDDVHRHLA